MVRETLQIVQSHVHAKPYSETEDLRYEVSTGFRSLLLVSCII